MRNAVLADTGPLYAALDPTDSNHGRAQEEIGRLNREGLLVAVSYPTLCESYSLILYKLGTGAAQGWLAEVRERASLVNPTPIDYGEAASRLRAYEDRALSMFDAVTAVPASGSKHRCGPTTTTSTSCASRFGELPDAGYPGRGSLRLQRP